MKQVTERKQANVRKLQEEIETAFPQWVSINEVGDREIGFSLGSASVDGSDELDLTVDFPDDGEEADVRQTILDHDHAGLSQYEALVNWFKTEIGPAVGMDVRTIDFTNPATQEKVFLTVLFALGAVDAETYQIRPLGKWLIPDYLDV